MYCTSCGANNEDSARFCESCGAGIDQPAGTGPVPVFNTGQVRRTKPVYFVIGAGLIIAVVIGGMMKFGGSGGSPETVMESFLQAVESQDQEAALDHIVSYERDILADYSPRVMELIEYEEPGEVVSTENALKNLELSFEGMEYDVELEGDTARVTVVDGRISMETVSGESDSANLPEDWDEDELLSDPTIIMVKESGDWRISVTRTLSEFYVASIERRQSYYDAYE